MKEQKVFKTLDFVALYLSRKDSCPNPFEMTQVYIYTCVCVRERESGISYNTQTSARTYTRGTILKIKQAHWSKADWPRIPSSWRPCMGYIWRTKYKL